MNLTDAYLVGSYTEFLVLLPYLAKVHEEKGLILMCDRTLGEVKRILDRKEILANVVHDISNWMTKLEKYPEHARELKPKDVLELGEAASKWRSEISRELESIVRRSS
jgi:hypothetical protein